MLIYCGASVFFINNYLSLAQKSRKVTKYIRYNNYSLTFFTTFAHEKRRTTINRGLLSMNIKHILTSVAVIAACGWNCSATAQMSREKADEARKQIISQWKADERTRLQNDAEAKCVRQGELSMPYDVKTFGAEPSDGRSLWISLHGGGNAPKALNDSQWENQKVLYQPAEGIYVAPRAPWDDWDMWFKPPIDPMYEQLIRTCVIYYNVNPDKVYLLGYSAGGDGVWRMAPRMADHWAAASMMAGHPGDVDMRPLRNLPFMIWCGGNDAAYDRNRIDAERGRQMDSLRRSDPEGYIHETHILPGKPHWMDLEDKAALPWMAQYHRNPYPTTIVWVQGDRMRPQFYWLGVSTSEAKKGSYIKATVKGNTITIDTDDYTEATLYLNDTLVNLDKSVTVKHGKKTVFKGKLPRTEANLRSSLAERGDPSYCFPAKVTVKL